MRVQFMVCNPGPEAPLGLCGTRSGQQDGYLQPVPSDQRICFIGFLSSIKIFLNKRFQGSEQICKSLASELCLKRQENYHLSSETLI